MYKVEFTIHSKKALEKFDKYTKRILLDWIQKNLEGCSNPRYKGKELKSNLSGLWRYRVGDYRILAQIVDDKILILIINIGHRREVYRIHEL